MCSNHTTLTIVASIAVMLRVPVEISPKTKQGVRALLTIAFLAQLVKRSVLIRDVRGSNLREAANIDPWRNRNASVCKTVMSRGSTGRVIQDKQIARLWKEIAAFFHALVDQLDGQRISTPPYAGSSSVERTKTST